MLPRLCLTTRQATVVAAQAAQEAALRADGKKNYLGLGDVSDLSLVCVLGSEDKNDKY